jgi:hypothetical protein
MLGEALLAWKHKTEYSPLDKAVTISITTKDK